MKKHTSQRLNGYNGGIAKGTIATSEQSGDLDKNIKTAVKDLFINNPDTDLKNGGFSYRPRYSQEEMGGDGGKKYAQPDMGVILKNGEIMAAGEGKHQGPNGNASSDRMYSQIDYLFSNGGKRMLLFITGEGVNEGNSMYRECMGKMGREGNPKKFNVSHSKGCSFFISENGFSVDQIKSIIKSFLLTE